MRLLAIDTALDLCSVAFAEADPPASAAPWSAQVESQEMLRGHAEALIPMIERVLAAAGAGYGDLDRIVATVGPGSFTGLRVGLAAARAIALAAKKPLVAVDTLAALAETHRPSLGRQVIAALIDARRSEVYAALFGADGELLAAPRADSAAAVAADFAPAAPVLVGSGAPLVAAAWPAEAGKPLGNVENPHAPDIMAVVRLGARGTPTTTARPLYLRPPDAKPQTRFRIERRCS